ncbi:hypothetical protein SteCoe_9151 [Stentor coeruleus]|uniref:Rab-GAP TBC domain-containing protein n=1 Tax=Stentor coeruleus TaxID=5963 RepID=A0A1R2CIL7_9CILI|nr:hypothetical protein SteCoe_9151 [Stentor coeruleus]
MSQTDSYCILPAKVYEYSSEEWEKILQIGVIHNFDQDRLKVSMKSGIPDNLRKEIWLFLTRSRLAAAPNVYLRLLSEPDDSVMSRIQRDLHRTFPSMKELNLQSLCNILIAYSQFDMEVGYCQGMGFVAGVLLLVIEEEELVFWSLVYIMYDKNWRAVYLNNTPKLNQLLTELESNIKQGLPKVYKRMCKEGVQMVMLSQYFITILAYKVKNRFAVRVMDMFLCIGEQVIIKSLYTMLRLKQEKILKLKNEYLFRYLIETLVSECYDEYHTTTLFAD